MQIHGLMLSSVSLAELAGLSFSSRKPGLATANPICIIVARKDARKTIDSDPRATLRHVGDRI